MVLQMEYSSFNTPEGACMYTHQPQGYDGDTYCVFYHTPVFSLVMVHLRCKSYSQSAQCDLEMVAKKLLKIHDIQGSCSDGPNVLWSVYFNRTSSSIDQQSTTTTTTHKPPNVHIVSDPDGTIGFEQAVIEVRQLANNAFRFMYDSLIGKRNIQ